MAQRTSADPVEDDERRQISVLYVDDYPELCRLAEAGLEDVSERIRVETTTEPTGVTDRLDEVDCIVSDYQMPGTDGLELLRQVRVFDEDLPFILFTGNGSEDVASDAISLGVTDYLTKSGSHERFARLAKRVEGAVRAHRASEAVERTRTRARATIERERGIADRLLEVATAPVLVVEADGTVSRANRPARETFDVGGDLVGRSFAGPDAAVVTVDGQTVAADEHPWTVAVRTGRRLDAVDCVLALSGGRFATSFDVAPAPADEPEAAVVTVRRADRR